MPGNTFRPSISRQPAPLRARIAQADHLARALGFLSGKAAKSDPAFLWLLGRADEVRTLVDEIVREWSEGSIDAAYASEAIGSYVGALHLALHRRYGQYGASCCGPHLEPFDGASALCAARSTPEERRGVRGARPQGARLPLESGEQTLTSPLEVATEAPPSGTRATSAGVVAARKHAPAVSAQRKSVG